MGSLSLYVTIFQKLILDSLTISYKSLLINKGNFLNKQTDEVEK